MGRAIKFSLWSLGGAAVVGAFIFTTVFAPVITFVCAYIGGMLLDLVVGKQLVAGLNLMFDTARFTRDLIPLTCGTLATIGRYFKSTQTNNNEKSEHKGERK